MANDSSSDFNIPEFKEYDPTPYCGGYDLTLTYGKPLPPSDSICYSPSFSLSNSPSLNDFSYASIPSPYGTSMADQANESHPTRHSKEEVVKKEEEEEVVKKEEKEEVVDKKKEEEEEVDKDYDENDNGNLGDYISSNGYGYGYGCEDFYDNQHWSDYGYGKEENNCNYGKQEPQDYLGPCPSIFGYWPCLYKKDKNGDEPEKRFGNQWEETAQYLFGSNLYPYGERKDEDVSYGYCLSYERHNQARPHLIQLDHNENSAFQMQGHYETYQEEKYPALDYVSSDSNPVIHERHYKEEPHSLDFEYKKQLWFQKPAYHEAYHDKEYPALEHRSTESNLVIHYHGYERHYQEEPHSNKVEYNEQSWLQKPERYEACHEEEYPALEYGSYHEQLSSVHVDRNEQSLFQKQGYGEAFHDKDYPRLEYVSSESNFVSYHSYERHYQEEPHFAEVEYNEQRQYAEAYQEEEYPAYNYGDDLFRESSKNFYNQSSYYDE